MTRKDVPALADECLRLHARVAELERGAFDQSTGYGVGDVEGDTMSNDVGDALYDWFDREPRELTADLTVLEYLEANYPDGLDVEGYSVVTRTFTLAELRELL